MSNININANKNVNANLNIKVNRNINVCAYDMYNQAPNKMPSRMMGPSEPCPRNAGTRRSCPKHLKPPTVR